MSKNTKATVSSGLLETMTITEVRSFHPEVMVIPLGSTEPHGPHLPYGTDTILADGLTREAVELANLQDARILRLPALPFGNNVNFKDFPFACRLRIETLIAVIEDLVTFAVEEGVKKIVIVNCHGGNDATVNSALRSLFDRFQNTAFVGACGFGAFSETLYRELFFDASPHAGDFETSVMMYYEPELVRDSERRPAAMNSPILDALASGRVSSVRNWAQLMPESCGGRPDEATAEKGRRFAQNDAAGLADFLVTLSRSPWHPGFPYPQTGNESVSNG